MNIIDRSYQIRSRYFTAPRDGLYLFCFFLYVSDEILNADIKVTLDKNGDYFADIPKRVLHRYYGPSKNLIRGRIEVELRSNETAITRININDGKTDVIPCEFEDNPELEGMTIKFT